MAVEDFGAAKAGLKVEIVSADHQNKPDVGSNIARQWYDTDKVDVPEERKFVGLDAYQKAIDADVDLVIMATPPGFRPRARPCRRAAAPARTPRGLSGVRRPRPCRGGTGVAARARAASRVVAARSRVR